MKGNMVEIAEIFGVARSTVDNWIHKGCPGEPPNKGCNQWQMDSAKVFRWLMNEGKPELDLVQEKARESIKRQKKLELEIEEKQRRLIPKEEVEKHWGEMISAARAKLLSLPTKISPGLLNRDSLPEVQAILKKHIYEALNELAQGE